MSPWEYLLQPAILFFLLGVVAALVKSDLEIPGSVLKILSLYLLFALGLKGGWELQKVTDPMAVAAPLIAATVASFLIPLIIYPILRRKFDTPDAAALAATYGSVSAVTFITAASYLGARQMEFGGYMVAALVLMESPAILIGLIFARRKSASGQIGGPSWQSLIHECFANKSVLVLLGSLLVGMVTPASGQKALHPFAVEMFPGMLCFFLMDLGLVATRRIADLKRRRVFFDSFWGSLSVRRWLRCDFCRPRPIDGGGGCLAVHDTLRQRVLHRRSCGLPSCRAGGEPRCLCGSRSWGDFPV